MFRAPPAVSARGGVLRAPKPSAHGRQNGGAKSLALNGPPRDSGSSVNRAKVAEEEERKRRDNAAMAAARRRTAKDVKRAQHERKQQLDEQVRKAEQTPGFFYAKKSVEAPQRSGSKRQAGKAGGRPRARG